MGTSSLKSFSLKVLALPTHEFALKIARSLPEWFTEDDLRLMALDFIYQRGAVAMDGETPIGFISFGVSEGKARIGWMGVAPEYQNQGVGKYLLTKLLSEFKSSGVTEITIRAFRSRDDKDPYVYTREFFSAFGFLDYEPSPAPGMIFKVETSPARISSND